MDSFDSLSRLKKEYKELNIYPLGNFGITVGLPYEKNIYEWQLTLTGAIDTIYNGGIFFLKLVFPKEYPNKAPELYFITPIYHLNVRYKKSVSPNNEHLGHVNLSFLNSWNPSNTPKEMLTKLYTIFYLQNPESPYGLDRYDEYRYNRALFEEKARYFTKKYANVIVSLKKKKDENKDWDFSFDKNLSNFKATKKEETPKNNPNKIANNLSNEKINLFFDLNGIKIKMIECTKNEITRNVVKKAFDYFNLKVDKTLLFIFGGKKLNYDIPITENDIRIQNNAIISIIYDVEL